jgi:hypothetical protein
VSVSVPNRLDRREHPEVFGDPPHSRRRLIAVEANTWSPSDCFIHCRSRIDTSTFRISPREALEVHP